jgi:hypothetical protein
MKRAEGRSILTDIVFGLIAGAAATFVMDKVGGYLYSLEDGRTRRREETLRGNEYPPEVLAEKVAGVELDRETRQKYGTAIHWGYGVMWGGLFGALRERAALIGRAQGLGFGTGLWLVGDEVLMPPAGTRPAVGGVHLTEPRAPSPIIWFTAWL